MESSHPVALQEGCPAGYCADPSASCSGASEPIQGRPERTTSAVTPVVITGHRNPGSNRGKWRISDTVISSASRGFRWHQLPDLPLPCGLRRHTPMGPAMKGASLKGEPYDSERWAGLHCCNGSSSDHATMEMVGFVTKIAVTPVVITGHRNPGSSRGKWRISDTVISSASRGFRWHQLPDLPLPCGLRRHTPMGLAMKGASLKGEPYDSERWAGLHCCNGSIIDHATMEMMGFVTKISAIKHSSLHGKTPGGSAMISLRRFELSDADVVWEWMGDEHVGRYTSWDAFATREAAVEYFRASILPHPWYRAICLDGRPAGFVAAKPGSGIDGCRAEVSYGLARRCWGRGVATAAVKMAAAELFEEWPHLERLEGLAAVENVASQRVLEKAGFRREGVLRSYRFTKGKLWDMICYSLTTEAASWILCSGSSPMDGRTSGASAMISLRRFELSDADVVWEWMGDEHVVRYTSWDPFSREAAVEYFRASILPHPWYRAICLDGRPAGFVAAKPGSGIDGCRAEVSYGLARRCWGRGVATAAVKMAAAELFEEWPHLERLEGLVALENVASQRVLEKAGFLREGVLRSYRFGKERPHSPPMDGKTSGASAMFSLRRFELSDADLVWEWMGDEQVCRYMSWDPRFGPDR
ncbi:hypothetical protein Taro_047271, partial [Colocasia esculenta]|nr:hypothetical protein [Colocasia esculenta]